MDDYVLKVSGTDSYIHGNFELQQYSQIVRCLSTHQDIELWLVKKLDCSQDLPRDVPDVSCMVVHVCNLPYAVDLSIQWNLIDESTGLTGTHEELSALSKEHTEVFTMSMWDIQRKFRWECSIQLVN